MVTDRKAHFSSDLAIHPGEVLGEELEARSTTQRALAQAMGRPEQVINEIVKGKKRITADTALQLGNALGTSAELWMNLQSTYDLTLARSRKGHRRGRSVSKVAPRRSPRKAQRVTR
jgi:addiction module HigA family antidote